MNPAERQVSFILTGSPCKYSPLYAKLSVTVETFFNQTSLKDKNIINELYQNFFLDGEINFIYGGDFAEDWANPLNEISKLNLDFKYLDGFYYIDNIKSVGK